jgi:hypothetical protein
MEQSKIIEFADAYNASRIARLRKLEENTSGPGLWGYLDADKQVVRCHMWELLQRYGARDPLGPGAMDRIVGSDWVRVFWVSTVFLATDYGWNSKPMWFETMVFRGRGCGCDVYAQRYETYDEALMGHQRTIGYIENRTGWARWLGYSQSHLRKIQREQAEAL